MTLIKSKKSMIAITFKSFFTLDRHNVVFRYKAPIISLQIDFISYFIEQLLLHKHIYRRKVYDQI